MRQIIGLCCFIVEESGGHKTDICSSATSVLGFGLQDFSAKSIGSLRDSFPRKNCCSFGLCPNEGGEGPAQIF